MASTVFFVIFWILGITLYRAYKFLARNDHLPHGTKTLPGPEGLPILGSVHELPGQHIWLKFYEWAKTYGPIYQVNLAGINHVWISSTEVAEDLLVNRRTIYSHRPYLAAIMHDSRYSGHYLPLMGHGDGHKRGKRFMNSLLSGTPKERLISVSSRESKNLVANLLADHSNFQALLETCTASISSQLAWNNSDPAVAQETLRRANELLRRISPDGAIENKLPFLRQIPSWVPDILQPWSANEKARYKRERSFWLGEQERVRSQIDKQSVERSWMETFLASKSHAEDFSSPENDIEAAYNVGMMALIGSVLVSSPIQSFFLAMCHFPEWQTKAQAEIDEVCGARVPSYDDLQSLPLLRAIIRETFRWRPPVPMGVPHVLEKDDVYQGYFIPKDSIVFALEWGMTRDESLYPDPESFLPERWLDPAFPTFKEPKTCYPQLKGHSGFGWGGRVCIGQDYTEVVHVMVISTILWSCTITKKKDPDGGNDVKVPWLDYGPYAIVRPNSWELKIKPRDEWRIETLRSCD